MVRSRRVAHPPPLFLFSFLFVHHVQVDFVGAQGWFVTLAGYLLFDGEIESCCRGRFTKTLPCGESQNPNRMASDAMENPI
uniref:Uncharacterized protein n=1 Tax=Fagus sylvatica TaxID=28930 RepID=A0A2N9FMV8_FAGSY